MSTRIDKLEEKIDDLKQISEVYEYLCQEKDKIICKIYNTCRKYTKAELCTNDENLGKAQVADEIITIIMKELKSYAKKMDN